MTTETLDAVVAAARRWVERAADNGHRCGVLLRGQQAWCRRVTDAIATALEWEDTTWFTAPDLSADAGRALLGGEVGAVVVDLRSPGAPDTLGAAAGAIRRGGVLVVWAEETTESGTGHAFAQRFSRVFGASPGIATLREGGAWNEGSVPAVTQESPSFDPPYQSLDQARAVAAVEKVARGRSGRPAVLISDRGRGKSSALGLAAASLLRERPRTIWLVAPSLASVAPVFRHASEQLGVAATAGTLEAHGGRLEFRAPADLVGPLPAADLVLVDEAAALPIPFLERLLERYRRLVFATTVHGYEGTGRGFTLRFQPLLQRDAPGGETVLLETPIRWGAGDPVEAALFDGLLMNADTAPAKAVETATPEVVTVEWLSREALLADEATLRRLFGLLVSAHYRTTPADLKRLLDDPRGRIVILRLGEQVVGAAFVMVEGRLDAALSTEVRTGRRRPHGHLLPEALWAHLGHSEALEMGFWRVVRIAVHPACRRVGLGRRLLEVVAIEARHGGADCWGATFGATAGLLGFWRSAAADVVRVGVSPGRSSGLVSAIVLTPLTDAGEVLCVAAKRQLADELAFALGGPLRDLSPAVALALLRTCSTPDVSQWPTYVRGALAGVADRTRSVEVSTAALWRFSLAALTSARCADALEEEGRVLLLRRFLQRHSWSAADVHRPARGRKPLSRIVVRVVQDGLAALGLLGDR